MLIKKKYIHCYKQDPDQGEKVPDLAGKNHWILIQIQILTTTSKYCMSKK